MRGWILLAAGMVSIVGVSGCGKSGAPAAGTGTGTPAAQEQLKQDVKAVGQDLKEVARDAAVQVKPALTTMKENAKDALHTAAEKVAEATATRPAQAR